MVTNHSILEQLNPTERRLIRAMHDKFWLDAESRPLNECGWCDFDGISGADDYDPDEWVSMGIATTKPRGARTLYRLTESGLDFAETLPSPYDDPAPPAGEGSEG